MRKLLACLALAVAGCAAGPPTYQVGPYGALNARDAETAYTQQQLTPVGDQRFDKPIVIVRAAMPEYAEATRNAGIQGACVMRFTVEPDGSVGDVTTVASPHRDLARSAAAALRQWRFEPLAIAGQPTRAVFETTFQFIVK